MFTTSHTESYSKPVQSNPSITQQRLLEILSTQNWNVMSVHKYFLNNYYKTYTQKN